MYNYVNTCLKDYSLFEIFERGKAIHNDQNFCGVEYENIDSLVLNLTKKRQVFNLFKNLRKKYQKLEKDQEIKHLIIFIEDAIMLDQDEWKLFFGKTNLEKD